jgi:hypothetical protein
VDVLHVRIKDSVGVGLENITLNLIFLSVTDLEAVAVHFLHIEHISAMDLLNTENRLRNENKLKRVGGEVVKVTFNGMIITEDPRDAFFKLKSGEVVKVDAIFVSNWNDLRFTCARLKVHNLFSLPFTSDLLDIHEWNCKDFDPNFMTGVKVEDIAFKFCCLPMDLDNKNFVMTSIE